MYPPAMYPPSLSPRPPEPAGHPARNSFALLVCAAFLIAVGASKGLGFVVTALLGAVVLALVGLIFAVIALARGKVVGGVFLLLGWLAFLPVWSFAGIGYGTQISVRQPLAPLTAESSAWEHWIAGVELGFKRAVAQRVAARQAAAVAPATPGPVSRAEQDFATAVEESKRRAIRRYPELAVAGSEFNRVFVAEYNRLTAQRSGDLLLVTWPETLADECAGKNTRVSRR